MKGSPQTFFATNFARPHRIVSQTASRTGPRGPGSCGWDRWRVIGPTTKKESGIRPFFCVVTSRRFIAPRSYHLHSDILPGIFAFSPVRVEIPSAADPGGMQDRCRASSAYRVAFDPHRRHFYVPGFYSSRVIADVESRPGIIDESDNQLEVN